MAKSACVHMIRPAIFVVALFLLFLALPSKPAQAATLHNVNGWAWSGTTGWIAVNCEDPKPGFATGDCAPGNGNYGLDIDNTGNLSGWAWSVNNGWICFGATCDGLIPGGTPVADHYCAGHVPCARYEQGDGELHGWAYIMTATDGTNYRGWISLNCTDVDPNAVLPYDCGDSTYHADFDEASGYFHGYAWNGNTDTTGNGWVLFACGWPRTSCSGPDGEWGVSTGWVTSGWSSINQQEGVYSPDPPPATGLHLTAFPIVFNDLSAPADSVLRCFLRMADGNLRQVDWNIAVRTYRATFSQSYTVQPSDGLVDASTNPLPWSFSAAGPYGCEIIGTPPVQKTVPNLVAVHPSGWTFTGAGGPLGSDSNRARFCLEGNLGTDPLRAYFLNTVQCDTEGDLAFTMLKAKGVKVEILCRDTVDDDSNTQTDFAGTCNAAIPITSSDRSCRGITYLCITHPAAPTAQPPAP